MQKVNVKIRSKTSLVISTSRILISALVLNVMLSSMVFAIDPPANIQLNDGELSWDAVEGVREYHIYYFDEPIPSSSNLGNYVRLTGGTSWPLDTFGDPFGFYTVVAVQTDDQSMPVEFSAITEGAVVAYMDPNDDSSSVSSLNSIVIIAQLCENLEVGSSCIASCPSPSIPTGGACRANAGVVLHHRALQDGYQCLPQQDTSFVETDVFCLN